MDYENIINEEEEVNIEVIEDEELETTSNAGVIAKVALAVAAGVATGVAIWKNKDKVTAWIDDRKIKRLEKRGYVVTKPELAAPTQEEESNQENTEK